MLLSVRQGEALDEKPAPGGEPRDLKSNEPPFKLPACQQAPCFGYAPMPSGFDNSPCSRQSLEGTSSTSLEQTAVPGMQTLQTHTDSMRPFEQPGIDPAPGVGFQRIQIMVSSMSSLNIPAKVAACLLPSALELATDPSRWLLAGPGGLPMVLFDDCGGQWPMICHCSRNGIQLQKGWDAYAKRHGLEIGDQLQLQRRGVIARPGCIYLDVRRLKAPCFFDSGMSTSEQLSEDTQPCRRPSAGKSSGAVSAIGSCQSPGKASPPPAPEGTWSASAAAVAPRCRSQPTVTSPRKPLMPQMQRDPTNVRVGPSPSALPSSRKGPSAARLLSLHAACKPEPVLDPAAPGPSRDHLQEGPAAAPAADACDVEIPSSPASTVTEDENRHTKGQHGGMQRGDALQARSNAEQAADAKDTEIQKRSNAADAGHQSLVDSANKLLLRPSARIKRIVAWTPFSQAGEESKPQDHPAGSEPLISIERKITCPTYCNRLHVTQTMALQLLPRVSDAQMKGNVSGHRNGGQQQYQALFKFKLRLTDELGNQWPVQYEGFVSSGQRHYRLTAGWTALVKHKQIAVGDSVVLERWGEDRTDLRLRVLAGDGSVKKPSMARSKSSSMPSRAKRASRASIHAARSLDTDMLDASSDLPSEPSNGNCAPGQIVPHTTVRQSSHLRRQTSQHLAHAPSEGSLAARRGANSGLRPSDMQAWAMGAHPPKAARPPQILRAAGFKRSATSAGLPDSPSCFPGSDSVGQDSPNEEARQHSPTSVFAGGAPKVSRRKRSMQPTRAAESGWTTAPGATSIGIRSRSAPAAVVAPPPANAKSSDAGSHDVNGSGPTKKPRSRSCRIPRSVWTSPVLGKPKALSKPANAAEGSTVDISASSSYIEPVHMATAPVPLSPSCPDKSSGNLSQVLKCSDEGEAGPIRTPRRPGPARSQSDKGLDIPSTPAQPTPPALDPILAQRAMSTLNIINAVGKVASPSSQADDIASILRQKFLGCAHPATS